ncbi:arylacetamide deacetylase-like [Brachionus plicatilis]|uniref:Arylacetamide deacetylase-like n=1 Tax=Brachionus plicatilis TaxID=10195 RepID=A0A3M7QHB4_BRAPC|nr:arylacetamide deacetylase-like [Brachionus plicatilis]
MLQNSKIGILIAIVSILCLSLTQKYINEDFEDHLKYYVGYFSIHTFGTLAKFLNQLKIVPEYSFMREFFNVFSIFPKNDIQQFVEPALTKNQNLKKMEHALAHALKLLKQCSLKLFNEIKSGQKDPSVFLYLGLERIKPNKKNLKKMDKKGQKEVQNQVFNGIKVRVYRPSEAKDSRLPLMIYSHGGAFFMGNPNFYDRFLSKIANETRIAIISINYRLAPEFPFPISINDCWRVVEHVLENWQQLDVDLSKLILGGDSAGGNIAMVLSKRLAKEIKVKPIFQILIYPWTQLAFPNLPSLHMYKTGLLEAIHHSYLKLWYLGFNQIDENIKELMDSNNHTLLLNETERQKMISYLDVNLIAEKYKKGKFYYKTFDLKNFSLINTGKLDENSVLVKNKDFAEKIKKLFAEEVSPALTSLEELKFQPKTYEIICEIDSLKDEGLILSERLRQAGVEVRLAFYDQCFHGMFKSMITYLISTPVLING